MLSNLEHADEFLLQGWACHEDHPHRTVSVDIHINERIVARVPAGTFRNDLKEHGFGSGHHAFFFNPLDYLTSRSNSILVVDACSGQVLAAGARTIESGLATNRDAYRRARVRSQLRWLNAAANAPGPPDALEFINRLEPSVNFHPHMSILEIGCGSGYIFEQLRSRQRQFHSYWGLDLSRARIENLHARFGSQHIRFLAGDASTYPFPGQFNLALASGVFDGLFPSMLPMLKNVCRALFPGGLLVFDLIVQDDRASISRAAWDGDSWLRLYSQQELRRLLTQAGMELLDCPLYAVTGTRHRILVSAMKVNGVPENIFEKW